MLYKSMPGAAPIMAPTTSSTFQNRLSPVMLPRDALANRDIEPHPQQRAGAGYRPGDQTTAPERRGDCPRHPRSDGRDGEPPGKRQNVPVRHEVRSDHGRDDRREEPKVHGPLFAR